MGFPFTMPHMVSPVEDFSGSTENMPGQGYWYSLDREQEDEVLLFLKLPEPLTGQTHKGSPYRTKTVSFRFFDWLPRAVKDDLRRAERAEREGHHLRAKSLRMRAAKFADMHAQLVNTIRLQHATYELVLDRGGNRYDSKTVQSMADQVQRLRYERKCGPPRLVLRGNRLELQIPFLPPTREMADEILGPRDYTREAGADRGLRENIAVSVEGGVDELISCGDLMRKRNLLRQQTRVRSSCRELGRSWTSAEGSLNARASYVTHEVVPTRELASRSDPSAVTWEDRTPVSNFVQLTMNGPLLKHEEEA